MAMKHRNIVIHVICWSIVLFLPWFFVRSFDTEGTMRWTHFLRSLGGPLAYMLVFYANYLWLVPHLYQKGKRWQFVVANVAVVAVAIGFILAWDVMVDAIRNAVPPDDLPPRDGHDPGFGPHRHRGHHGPPRWPMWFWQTINVVLVIGLAVAVRLSQRWQHLENARREAERSRTEAELKNLRSQLNPHFLLNTLNNIYALIAFDQDKAQHAVEELSKLLRHVLYDNQQEFVPLYQEVAFMHNYVELMKIRVSQGVTITEKSTITPNDATPIAPLIFISLVENAFKHGISPQGKGQISISFSNEQGIVSCEIVNSNYPKRANDKSGSGIGLQQVQKRLDLTYPTRYTWQKGVSPGGTEYYSKITINTAQTKKLEQ